MKRLLALGGACLLVAGALLVRQAASDDGDDGGGGGDDGDGLVVACIPELEAACEGIEGAEVRVEDPGVTIDALVAGEAVDAWVTLDPWPEMAGVIDPQADLGPPVPVAETELVLLVRNDAVPDRCGDAPIWTCVVDELGDDVAVPTPASASGRLVLGHAAADFFGRELATNDFGDPDFARRIGELDTTNDDPVDDLRVGFPLPLATGTLATDLARLGRRIEDFTQSPGASPATVAVVVAGPLAEQVAGDDAFLEGLAALGWRVAPDAATSGLPDAGVLVALAEEIV